MCPVEGGCPMFREPIVFRSCGCRSRSRDLERDANLKHVRDKQCVDISPSYSMPSTSEDQSNVLQAARNHSREHPLKGLEKNQYSRNFPRTGTT